MAKVELHREGLRVRWCLSALLAVVLFALGCATDRTEIPRLMDDPRGDDLRKAASVPPTFLGECVKFAGQTLANASKR
jgi:hypothetical protein